LNGNALQAAKNAGYSDMTANKVSYKWLGRTKLESSMPDMWDYLQELREKDENEFNVTKGKILKRWDRISSFDARKLFDDYGDLLPLGELDDDTVGAIAGIEVEEKVLGEQMLTRIKKIKIADRNAANSGMAKMLGYNAAEKVQHEVGESFYEMLKRTSANSGKS
jgi:hypothetical protein